MKSQQHIFEHLIAGKKLTIKTGILAKQAHGAVLVSLGETVVLATAVMGKKSREGINYFPLMVDYEEKFYAAGKILGSRFIKRESRPSEEAILTARLIDRTLRPLFNHQIRNDVQIIVTVLGIDGENDPDVPGMIAASCALSISNIPWDGPIGAVRISKTSGELNINPTYEEREKSATDLVVAGTTDKVNMMEAGAFEVTEEEITQAIEGAQKHINEIINFQKKIVEKLKPEKLEITIEQVDKDFQKEILDFLEEKLEPAIYIPAKTERLEQLTLLEQELKKFVEEKYPDDSNKLGWAREILEEETSKIVHQNAIEKNKRPDGRTAKEIRNLSAQVGFLNRAHGSALFERGLTQALSVLTLGSPSDQQLIEGMEIQTKKRFMHHYNFPPYSVGEIGPMRGPGRRDIGHGALAERALISLIPQKEQFPYTIRLVSEILSSNGSSSMASVCGSSLALMDGGVPIKNAAAGIAIGLMMEGEKYRILTDIQGPEDHHGDMDLKVAGTKNGITALQMDVKVNGLNIKIIREALEQAREARFQILEIMNKTIKQPKENLSSFAPRILTLQINPEKIREVIGPQGKVINGIIKETGAAIDIEDDGLIFITAENEKSANEAQTKIKNITRELEVGEVFEGRVVKLMDFGAFIGLTPRKEGLLHVSELIPGVRVRQAQDLVKVGDSIKVKIKGIDELKRINLILADPKTFENFRDKILKSTTYPSNNGEKRQPPRRFKK